jgi:superfamily II DNA or RNA helicase
MEAVVGSCGRLCVPAARTDELLGTSVRKLKALLTVRKKMYKGPDLVAKGYSEVEVDGTDWLLLPRRLAEALPGRCVNVMAADQTAEMRERLAVPFPAGAVVLFDYQIACAEAVMRSFFSPQRVAVGAGMGYLNLPAGRGKTLVGVEVARQVGGRCAVVAPRAQICEQWLRAFEDHIPGVAAAMAGAVPPEERAALREKTVVIMSPALALKETDWSQYALVLIDEAHMMCAQNWRQVLERQTAARVLGLSATTEERADEMDPVAKWHLGEPLRARTLPGFEAMDVEFYGALRVIDVRDPQLARQIQGMSHSEAQQELHRWPAWVAAVAHEVQQLLDRHEAEDLREGRGTAGAPPAEHNVIVFAEHREAVAAYAEALRGAGAVAPEVAEMMGGTAGGDATRALRGARVIVTTYSYSAVGISMDRFTAAVFTTTRKTQLYQILSRILRVRSDTAVRRDYVAMVGPRRNWRDHCRAMQVCAAAQGFAVATEKRENLD